MSQEMNKNVRLFEDLRIPLEQHHAPEKRDNQSGQTSSTGKPSKGLTREPHFDADTGKPITEPEVEKPKDSFGTTFLPGGPIDSLGRTEGAFKPITDLGHDDQFEPKGPSHKITQGGAQFGDQMGSSKPIDWQAGTKDTGHDAGKLSPEQRKAQEWSRVQLWTPGQERVKDQAPKIKQGGEPFESEQQRAEGWSRVQLWTPGQERVKPEIKQGGEPFKLSPEEQQRAEGWSRVQLWTPSQERVKDQAPKITEEQQRAEGWSRVQLWTPGQDRVKDQAPKIKQGGEPFESEQQRAEGWSRAQLWTPGQEQIKQGGEPFKLSPEEQQRAEGWSRVQLWTPSKPAHTGILAGFRKLFHRSKSADTTQGPKEFTPLADAC